MRINSNKIELHYYFDDESHTMDAFVRNKCEHEILLIITDIASILELDLKIESEALIEGGLKEWLTVLAKNQFLQGVVAGILISIISSYLTSDRELTNLQKEELKLQIEKLKIELKKEQPLPTIDVSKVISYFNSNYKIVKHKSNYYKSLYNDRKVTSVATTILDAQNQETLEKSIVNRSEFKNFILDSDELPPDVDENATIEIISPVLKIGKYKWKGIYRKTENTIDFSMKDIQFKDEVIGNGVPFKNGTCIDCILEISKKLDEVGDIKITGYSVQLVTHIHDEVVSIETPQGKKHRAKKDADSSQLRLYSDNENI
jgi:hypothetical protein